MKIKDILSYCGLFIAAVMYGFIVVDVVVNPINTGFMIDRTVLIPRIIAALTGILAAVYLFRKIKSKRMFILIGFAVLILLQFISIKYLSVRYDVESWDMGVVYNAAQYYVNNGSFDMTKYDYFLWFPNNSPLYNTYVVLFGLLQKMGITNIQMSLSVFNGALILASVLFAEKTIQLLAGKEYAGIGVVMCILLSPFSLYTVLTYTDTFSMIFLSAALYYYVKFIRNTGNRYVNLGVFSLMVAVGASLKVSVLILAVAAVIDIILKQDKIKHRIVPLIIVITISFAGFSTLKYAHEHSAFLPEYDYNGTIPYTHWVMMGLNGLGGYCDDDYQLITLQYPDKETRQQANIREIVNRVKEKGPVGMIYHVANKLSYIHSDGTFTACCSLDKAAINGNELHNYVLCLGNKFHYFGYSSMAIFLSMIFVVSIGIFSAMKKKDTTILMPAISLVGLTIFLLLWEAQPRYIINFLPIVVVMTVVGIKNMFSHKIEIK